MRVVQSLHAVRDERFDVCVIGAGPVGLAVAVELGRLNRTVLVLEAGAEGARPNSDWMDAEVMGSNHAPLHHALARGLGGTSAFWGGRCIPLDPEDFSDFDRHRDRTWPFSEAELRPHYAAAAAYLGCGPAIFQDSRSGPLAGLLNWGVDTSNLERWCGEPFTPRHIVRQPGASNVTVALNADVKNLLIENSSQSVFGVALKAGGANVRLDIPYYVLAAGGIGNVRLLSFTRKYCGTEFARALGRFYMGHVSGSVSKIVFNNPDDAREFAYRVVTGSATRRLITIAPEHRIDANIPNIYFYPANQILSDASHGSGILSLLYLLLRIPLIGRHAAPEGILSAQLGGQSGLYVHVTNIAAHPIRTIVDIGKLLGQMILKGRRRPLLFPISPRGEYNLHYHAEHLPNPESRTSMMFDEKGEARSQELKLSFSEEDFSGVARAHEILARALSEAGIGDLKMMGDGGAVRDAIAAQAAGGYHQVGLTRTGLSSDDGVVDGDCKVFGVDNLFVAGASIFRTSGRANPTFSAVAIGLRAANHIHQLLR